MYFLSLLLLLSGVSNVQAGQLRNNKRENRTETNLTKEEEDQKILDFKADYVELFLLKTLKSALNENKAFDIGKSIDKFLSIESLGLSGISNFSSRKEIKERILKNLRSNGLLKINDILNSKSSSSKSFEQEYEALNEDVKKVIEDLMQDIADRIEQLKAKAIARRDLTNYGYERGLSETSFNNNSEDQAFAKEVLDLAKTFGYNIVYDDRDNVVDIQSNGNLNIIKQKLLKELASQMYSTSEKEIEKKVNVKIRQNPEIGTNFGDGAQENLYEQKSDITNKSTEIVEPIAVKPSAFDL